MEEDQCIFCQIASKQMPTNAVYEDERTIAFLDIRPSSPGHTLVVPKKHYETLLDVPEDEAAHLLKVVKHVAAGIVESMKADGFNLLQNNKQAGYQLIPHMHFHVVPRFKNDGLPLGNLHQGSYKNEQEIKDVATRIRLNVKPVRAEERERSERREVGRKEMKSKERKADADEESGEEKEKKPRSRRLKKGEAFMIKREIEMA